MKLFLLLTLLLSLVLPAAAEGDDPYAPAEHFATRRTNVTYGQVVYVKYPSATTGTERRLKIILPPNYTEEKQYPVLYLQHDRLRPKNVNLDPERYDLLKGSCETRMQKMIDYVQEEDICRSSYLLEYFGQAESKACGTCDICRSEDSLSRLRRQIDEGTSSAPEFD